MLLLMTALVQSFIRETTLSEDLYHPVAFQKFGDKLDDKLGSRYVCALQAMVAYPQIIKKSI